MRFADLVALLVSVGFVAVRQAGLHAIYQHPDLPAELINLQSTKDGNAKVYQVEQVLAVIDKWNLEVLRCFPMEWWPMGPRRALPNCASHGDTAAEAAAEAQKAAELMIDVLGAKAPPSDHAESYSGTLRLRLPRYLHASLARVHPAVLLWPN